MAGPSIINPLKSVVDRQYSDTLVIKNKIFKERLSKARNFYRKDLFAHYGCVNAIEFSTDGELLVSGGDDRRVLIWSLSEAIYDQRSPISMKKNHSSNIFCVAFDSKNERIFSAGNDDQVIIHMMNSGNPVTCIPHKKPVYGLSINPQNDEIIATAGEDGRLLLYDVREAPNQETQVLAKQRTGFHSVMFNPMNPRFLVSANSEEGIALWDCRKPKEELVHYDSTVGKTSGISACFDSYGKKVLALRRRLPPVLYNTQSDQSICQFYHPQYYNSCTMKTCSFAGNNDEYVLSGSDDFNLYMWRIPEDSDEWGNAHVVIKGHRSIVNQVRYNKHNNLIASSGVEKMIKLWSTIPIGTWSGSLLKEHIDPVRIVYSHQDYINLVGNSGERISHDYSEQSTLEDAKMMAFFDSLIQREIEGWVSSEELQTTDGDSDIDQDWPKLVKKIFGNHRNLLIEEPKKQKHSKIAQLISKKKYRLAKMAQNKAPSSIKKMQIKKQRKEKNSLKQKAKDRFNVLFMKTSKKGSLETKRNRFFGENNSRYLRYRTRQCLKNARENASLNMLLDTPSTSTGITSLTSSVYRVLDQDSDEEVLNSPQNGLAGEENSVANNEGENLVNILPTPLNGSQEYVINGPEISINNRQTANSNEQTINVNNSNNESVVILRNSEVYNIEASTSRGYHERNDCKWKQRKLHNGTSKVTLFSDSDGDCPSTSAVNGYIAQDALSTTDSEYENSKYCTPPKKRRTTSYYDSGCGTGPSSTKSSRFMEKCACFNNKETPDRTCSTRNGHSSDEENRNERFRKRVRKARADIRSRVCADSDSN